ncbi:MAG: hypothetical protein PF570_05330 [Candidatus Cloacimonetes bacterium]|nr:hypothetical protein [Candidatus Cloacimonadota bacterium]
MILIDDAKIDWERLMSQKLTLGIISNEYRDEKNDKDTATQLDGIKHLIDHIQDSAVASGIYSEDEIFGRLDDKEKSIKPK